MPHREPGTFLELTAGFKWVGDLRLEATPPLTHNEHPYKPIYQRTEHSIWRDSARTRSSALTNDRRTASGDRS
jgi:hypothetical protein